MVGADGADARDPAWRGAGVGKVRSLYADPGVLSGSGAGVHGGDAVVPPRTVRDKVIRDGIGSRTQLGPSLAGIYLLTLLRIGKWILPRAALVLYIGERSFVTLLLVVLQKYTAHRNTIAW
mmetsp:Transcript_5600/g.11777  ORF Transcript_5600/g.11777 Transcript_5600/m.11777 type:complete len:121 (+) Transcript_5600:1773-2135(+)